MNKYFLTPIAVLIFYNCTPHQEQDHLIKKPNLVLILTDDQGYGDLSLHGNDSLNTPNLDMLGEKGLRFDRFYVSPVCAPTRASLLTGRYHMRTGVYWVTRGAENMDPEEVTLAEVFNENGYTTGCFGKWHNGAHYPYTPNAQGFDEFIGFKAGHWSNYFDTELNMNEDTIATDGFITDVLTDKAINFIQENKNDPFFCYIPYNAPHTPYQVPDPYFERLEQELNIEDPVINRKRATIYGMCENIDYNVGRLMTFLEESDLLENTLIVFITDNGPNGVRYNGNMRGRKGSVHEGGVRVPCFFYWKDKIKEGSIITGLAAHIDILPTVIGLFDLDFEEKRPLDGIDLSGYILNENEDHINERTLFTHQNQGSEIKTYPGAIRTEKYRFIINGENSYNLFDMMNDPEQQHDIAGQEPEVSQAFYKQYHNWFDEVKVNASKKRIIPVGYPASPTTWLPAHEAGISGGLSYKANINGWAHDWIINWDQVTDTISWNIDVVEAGQYEIYLKYNCRQENTGSDINVIIGDQKISEILQTPFNSEIHPHHDRVVRQVEAFEKDWTLFKIGTLALGPGDKKLLLFAPEIPGPEVAEVKAILIKKL